MEKLPTIFVRLLKGSLFSDAETLAKEIGMTLTASPPNPGGDYKWFSYSCLPTCEEVNVMEEFGQLRRTECLIERAKAIDGDLLENWKRSLVNELGTPIFSGDFRDEGFPDDEEGLHAATWSIDEREVVLLNRKDDDETPAELVLVVKQ
ncbi:hypothetical protein [Rhodopirellula sp. SWK7]|uniref:hypothetical protein n=1 Tax=Rhodopirellula sp. SWK7 TaxID=595460 RepID=UPI0002BF392D|nr:hypothetical protein [Rhodopirellula sp. SWK7]EMI42893.1 hypothetical protein RRSWK_04706 [Rhodopirellula sp. SWK7]